jgi:hypothetical protein
MTDTTDERTTEPIEEGDSFLTQIRKMREADLDLYIVLQMTVDLDKLKNELVAHQLTGQIIEGEDIQQIYKLPMVVLAWYERIPEDDSIL